jgi:hypothetical protein
MKFIIEKESYALMRAQVNMGMRSGWPAEQGTLLTGKRKTPVSDGYPKPARFFTSGDVCAGFFSFGNPR